jgi:uncharacterized protein (UPF0548 family)
LSASTFPFIVPTGFTRHDGDRLLDEMRQAELTYPEVGATNFGLPAGYKHGHHQRTVGAGWDDFAKATDGIRRWASHTAAGVKPYVNIPIEVGGTALFVARLAIVELRIACRIVSVIDEANRFGFSYGTLPCHPEIGEERFIVERNLETDSVEMRIDVFWKPGHWLSTLSGPIAPLLQHRYTNRYLDGMVAHVRSV